MTKKDITDAYCTIRITNHTIPDEVLNLMLTSAYEKLEGRLEKKFDSLFEFACKKLNTSELVYNYQDNTWRLPYNSAHSFTEGAEPVQSPAVEGDPKVITQRDALDSLDDFRKHKDENSIDFQINFIRSKALAADAHREKVTFRHIRENLESIKRWNETPVYHGEIDVAKVISDLCGELYELDPHTVRSEVVDRADKAIKMINRFKEEREAGMAPREAPEWIKKHAHVTSRPLTPKDVAEAHHAGVNILNRKAMRDYIPQVERDLLVNDLIEDLSRLMDEKIARRISNTIIFAIEAMDHLKRKYNGEQD